MASVAPTSDQNAETTLDIAPRGNLIFLVGPHSTRLRVHSAFVTAASPVFSAMLAPHFKEGHELADSGLTEISLPEDDAGAIEIVFNVIHGRNEQVAMALTPEEYVRVAVIIDKYDYENSLLFASQAWTSYIRSLTERDGPWSLSVTAMILRNREMYAEATSKLIFHHSGSYIDLALRYLAILDPAILLKIAGRLEESRNKLRMNFIHDAMGGDWHCTVTYKMNGHKADRLEDFVLRIGDLNQRSTSSVLEALGSVVEVADVTVSDWDLDLGPRNLHSVYKSISENCRRRHDREGGLCLLCITNEDDHKNHINNGI